jgi:hypothetical protein
LDIASVHIELAERDERSAAAEGFETRIRVDTRSYDAAEFFMPVRFCYSNRSDRSLTTTLAADWWSRIGSKAHRGRLIFDHHRQRIVRLHAERKLGTTPDATAVPIQESERTATVALDQERDEVVFPTGIGPMDRLTMILWLRRQHLAPGRAFDLGVSSGEGKLQGFHAEVEAEEDVDWQSRLVPSYRIRLEPKTADPSQATPIRVWIGRDAPRLPLLFRGSKGIGTFEIRLAEAGAGTATECAIPEAVGLALPTL